MVVTRRCIFTRNIYIFQSKVEDNGYHMIFEFADGGTLRTHLAQHFRSLTWKDKYKLSLEITNGLGHMHKLNIIHKDLVILICDYTLCCSPLY